MKLRIRNPPDNPILELDENSTFGFLREQVSRIVGMPPDDLTIKSGFPPLEIMAGDSCSLVEAKLREGDLITVQLNSSLGKQAMSSSPPPKHMRHQTVLSSTMKDKEEPKRDSFIHTLDSRPVKRRRKSGAILGASEEEWGVNLVEVFTKSGGLTAAQRMLKGAFRNAVRKRAESVVAEQRWASVQGKSYILYEPAIGMTKFKVTFPIGPRSSRTEEYLALPEILLRAVIKEVYDSGMNQSTSQSTSVDPRNNLRPVYLAELQPMVFWNLVRLFKGDIKEGLRSLCPEINWDFVDDRERKLSEKARLSLEQAQESKRERRTRHGEGPTSTRRSTENKEKEVEPGEAEEQKL